MTAPAVPFVLRRVHSLISGPEITLVREESHGLLRVEAGKLVAQWSTVRETSRVGHETRVDRTLGPVRQVLLNLTALAGARVRWRLFPWPPRWQLVLSAADLQAFRPLVGEEGLLVEHPVELVLDLHGVNRGRARIFAAELELALADAALLSAELEGRLPAPDSSGGAA